jgi:hypothetical protein
MDGWPPTLVIMRRSARLALRALRRTNVRTLSAQARAEHDDDLKVMHAMADGRKTAAVYFAMASAMGRLAGRPLSDLELAQADEISRALEQEPLNHEEQQAIERAARKHRSGTPSVTGGAGNWLGAP